VISECQETKVEQGGYIRTDLNIFYNNQMLCDIDRFVNSASAAKGMPIQTVLAEFSRTTKNEVRGFLSVE
jgi:hypothetical protein